MQLERHIEKHMSELPEDVQKELIDGPSLIDRLRKVHFLEEDKIAIPLSSSALVIVIPLKIKYFDIPFTWDWDALLFTSDYCPVAYTQKEYEEIKKKMEKAIEAPTSQQRIDQPILIGKDEKEMTKRLTQAHITLLKNIIKNGHAFLRTDAKKELEQIENGTHPVWCPKF